MDQFYQINLIVNGANLDMQDLSVKYANKDLTESMAHVYPILKMAQFQDV